MQNGLTVGSLLVATGMAVTAICAAVAVLATRLVEAGGAGPVGPPGAQTPLVPATAGETLFVLGAVGVGVGLLSVAAGAVVAVRSSPVE